MNPSEHDHIDVAITCPHCRAQLNAAVTSDGSQNRPQALNFTLCGECGQPSRLQDGAFGLVARELREDERDELPPSLIAVALAIQERIQRDYLMQNPN